VIRSLILENLKSFRQREEVPLKRLTLIYGQNSGGKNVDLGNYRALVADHMLSRNLTIGFSFDPPPRSVPAMAAISGNRRLEFSYSWDRTRKAPCPKECPDWGW
jgi:hypothetical protein